MKGISPTTSTCLTFSRASKSEACMTFRGASFFRLLLVVALVDCGRVVADAFRLAVVLLGTVCAFWRLYGARPPVSGSASLSSDEESGSACESTGAKWSEVGECAELVSEIIVAPMEETGQPGRLPTKKRTWANGNLKPRHDHDDRRRTRDWHASREPAP